MTISFEIPQEIEQQVRMSGADLDREARELFLVELYRQERITHHQLAEAMGLSRYETDGVLKRHKFWLELTPEELAHQAASFQEAKRGALLLA
jgi:predicted HTH domain antitoxin